MTDTASILVERMVEAGEWPEPHLLREILARGEEAVEPLLDVVRQDVHGWPEEAPLTFAVHLLGSLRATSAIPDLIELFRRYDDETVESVEEAVGQLGLAVIEPALEVVRDRALPWYSRTNASTAAMRAAGDDPALQARIAATLRALLADSLARADSLKGDELEMVTWLAHDLAYLADPLARDLIDAAFEADLIQTFAMRPEDVDQIYREGGRQQRPAEPRAWLEWYEREYQAHLEAERRPKVALPPAPPLPAPAPATPAPTPAVGSVRREHPKLGRNDPCWCGSGKKYKKCHGR